MNDSDTIVAPATPPGEGGVAIIRLSGPAAESILLSTFSPAGGTHPLQSHRLYYGHLYPSGQSLHLPLDEVMAVIMRAPRSYTREDVAEVHCHGGPLLVRRILDLFVEAGARLAGPGEFTLRAFLNGRLDLSRAEAVIDLIKARSDLAGQVALRQLQGGLANSIHSMRDVIIDLLAVIEAHIDFPEEDLDFRDYGTLLPQAESVLSEMERLIASFQTGRTLREGISILLLGRPNVGKSSLLNALLGESRAIVTEIPGTTRDTLEEHLVLGGLPLRLIDTAGVRDADDPIEVEGVRRAREKAGDADLIVLVIDGSVPPCAEDLLAFEACQGGNILLACNKSDLEAASLPHPFSDLPSVRVSARFGLGMDDLRNAILQPFLGGKGEALVETSILSDRRHRAALLRAKEGMLKFFSDAQTEASPEFLALDLRIALDGLGEITGETTPEEVLNRIFSRFCIGK